LRKWLQNSFDSRRSHEGPKQKGGQELFVRVITVRFCYFCIESAVKDSIRDYFVVDMKNFWGFIAGFKPSFVDLPFGAPKFRIGWIFPG
jgi:hypothetical protein